jgi:hypothetical protein
MSWRPEGWKNPYININPGSWDYFSNEHNPAFEAGADAMLEAIKKQPNSVKVDLEFQSVGEVATEYFKIIHPNGKGTLVFIPDEKETKG